MGEWRTLSVHEANVTLIDCDHRTPPASETGYPYIAIPQLRNGRLDLSEVRLITREHFLEWTRKAKPSTNDVVLSRRCNPGETAHVPPGLEFALGQNLVLLRADGTNVYPPFLRWLVQGPEWWEQVGKFLNVGAVFDSLKCADIPKFMLRVPPLGEQRAIAHILGTLDDKIELNRRMNETLEALARALFQSWFRAQERSYVPALDLMRDGVLEIGDGYRAQNSELGSTGLPFIRAANLSNGLDTYSAERLCSESVAKAGRKVSRLGDVAFTSKGTIGRLARVGEHTDRFVYSPQVCYWRSLDHERLDPAVLYCWMQTNDFKSQVHAVAGQTDMAPYVSLQDQRQIRVPASLRNHKMVARQIQPLLSRQSENSVESRTLAALRDTLLQRFISGELPVQEADRFGARRLGAMSELPR